MADSFMSMKNLKFTLHSKMSHAKAECDSLFANHPPKAMDMVLEAALDFAKKELHPIFEEMDRQSPVLENGQVKVHPRVKNILEILGRDGWIASTFPEKWGGEDMPAALLHCINFIFSAGNYSGSVYSGLTMGAANLILSYGSKRLQDIYLPPMLAGKWQGTMALTEPEAGSSLGDLTTRAVPVDNDVYQIFGEKIFISAGDHDGVDNVVHLMLARIDGAPAGSRGISLFVVPKFRPKDLCSSEENPMAALEENDVAVTQIFHKLGYRGAPITGLSFGSKNNCLGYLVGEVNKGLSYMFQMMNGARLEVGIGATAIATAAYHAALDHCRKRKQGRRLTQKKEVSQVPIISHPDVKRMLLFQRAVSEGALALILQCGTWEDMVKTDPDRTDLHLLLELLTPVAKTYPSEMGILATSSSIQCFGGYGYCEDYPVEQHFRDMRIHPIHEGTTGIQAMDLLGRKVMMEDGKAMSLLKEQMEKTIQAAASYEELKNMGSQLADQAGQLEKVTMELVSVAMKQGPEPFLADATLYLELFGITVIAWQWLSMAAAASSALSSGRPKKKDALFYQGKIHVAKYYYAHELPRAIGLCHTLVLPEKISLAMPEACFTK